MKLVLASSNQGKLEELRGLLADTGIELVAQSDLGVADAEETGTTFVENALIKARHASLQTGLPALADDSGICVDALNGAPGLHSGRYSTLPGATDADRRAKLLSALQGIPRPWTARFRCTVAFAAPGNEVQLFRGAVEGEILSQESGDHGFGYDRLFWVTAANKTMADLTMEEKNLFSHRAVALKKAIPCILETLK